MHGGSTATKVSSPKYVILGNGGFEVGSGPTGDIEREFMFLAKALGYTVIVVDETFVAVSPPCILNKPVLPKMYSRVP